MNSLLSKIRPKCVTGKFNAFSSNKLLLYARTNNANLKTYKNRSEKTFQKNTKVNKVPVQATTRFLQSSTKKEDPNITANTNSETTNAAEIKLWDVDFNCAEDAYKNKSNAQLFRALLVFHLCNFKWLVTYGLNLSHSAEKILGRSLFNRMMKSTFYGHFVAGENQDEVNQSMAKLQKEGIGAIMDYAVEEDLSEERAKDLEMSSCTADGSTKTDSDESSLLTRFKPHRQFGDRRQKVVSARTYFYEGETQCDENMHIFLKCIESAGQATDGGFAAIKLTALGRPQFLLQFSEVLVKGRQLFERFSGKQGNLIDKKFDLKRFESKAERLGILMSRDDSKRWFTFMDVDESGYVDLLDWNELIATNRKFSDIFQVLNPETGQLERLLPKFSDGEEAQMKRMLQRVNYLAEKAKNLGVRLMIDAEQTYFQPAISRIVMEMMRNFNKKGTIVMNTYQCYLKETSNNLLVDLALAERENFHFGLKLVRGAYMDQERERATQLNYEDPIQPNYEQTASNYNRNLKMLLKKICEGERITVMAATHNEDSIKYALRKMHDYAFSTERQSQVYFGQLLGMCDYITFPLGHQGHHVYKYVPFGPVKEVLPYLYRRAQENRSILSASKKERKLLRHELWRRLKPFSSASSSSV